MSEPIPDELFHVTTPKKARRYLESGHIKRPVRGFTTITAALAWGCKVGRTVVYSVPTGGEAYKLPDHHNPFGDAWWIDSDAQAFKCVFSAEVDA